MKELNSLLLWVSCVYIGRCGLNVPIRSQCLQGRKRIKLTSMKTYTFYDNTLGIELCSTEWQGRHDCECKEGDIIVLPEYKGTFIVKEVNGTDIYVSTTTLK